MVTPISAASSLGGNELRLPLDLFPLHRRRYFPRAAVVDFAVSLIREELFISFLIAIVIRILSLLFTHSRSD